MKLARIEIHAKFGGRCAYCGGEITLKQMQVDHVIPLLRGQSDQSLAGYAPLGIAARERGTNDVSNLYPACRPCNQLKSSYSLEDFRAQVDWNSESLRKYNCQYRHLLRFGRIVEVTAPVVFHFETFTPSKEQAQ